MSNTRLEYIDVAKGLLICLMVFGHILNIATYQTEANIFVKNMNMLETLYKGFYMCTFFVITGFCSNFNKRFSEFTKSNLKTIVLPAFTMFYITQTINLLYDGNTKLVDYMHFNFHSFFIEQGLSAWFLASLFVARNIYWFVNNLIIKSKYRFLLFAIFYVLGYYLSHHTHNYWSYQQALMFVIFLEYGQYLKRLSVKQFSSRNFIFCLCVYIALYLYTMYITKGEIVGIHRMIQISKETLLSNLLMAISGSYMILFLSQKIGKNCLLQYLGKNSLIVYLLNWHVIVIFWDVFHPLLGNWAFNNIVCYAAVFLLTISFCAIFIKLLNIKYVRCVIGK